MKLITFSQNGLIKVGAILNEEIVDLSALVKDEPWNLDIDGQIDRKSVV